MLIFKGEAFSSVRYGVVFYPLGARRIFRAHEKWLEGAYKYCGEQMMKRDRVRFSLGKPKTVGRQFPKGCDSPLRWPRFRPDENS